MIVTANDVKTKGVAFLGSMLEKADELIINVRGKNKYVVLDIERYQSQTAKEHIEELTNAL
ncbi:MAG: prevent-host-death protein [Thiomicrospira sp.]